MSSLSFKVMLLGEPGCGKTQLVNRYINNQFQNFYQGTPSVVIQKKEIEVRLKQLDRDFNVDLHLIDLNCSKSYVKQHTSYYSLCRALVLVFDLTDQSSFFAIKNWLESTNLQSKKTCLRFLVGTKADLNEGAVSNELIDRLCKSEYMSYFETSSKDNTEIEDMFYYIAKKMLEQHLLELSLQIYEGTDTKSRMLADSRQEIKALNRQISELQKQILQKETTVQKQKDALEKAAADSKPATQGQMNAILERLLDLDDLVREQRLTPGVVTSNSTDKEEERLKAEAEGHDQSVQISQKRQSVMQSPMEQVLQSISRSTDFNE